MSPPLSSFGDAGALVSSFIDVSFLVARTRLACSPVANTCLPVGADRDTSYETTFSSILLSWQCVHDRRERGLPLEECMLARRLALMLTCAILLPVNGSLAADPEIKPPIRGLVSMGAYRFVGQGGDPVNTLKPLDAKAGIFGGLVVIASWKQLQPTPGAEIGDN